MVFVLSLFVPPPPPPQKKKKKKKKKITNSVDAGQTPQNAASDQDFFTVGIKYTTEKQKQIINKKYPDIPSTGNTFDQIVEVGVPNRHE